MVSDPGALFLPPNANHNAISCMVYAEDRCNLDLTLLPRQPFVQAKLRLSRRLCQFETHIGTADESQADSSEPADSPTALRPQRLAQEVTRHVISAALMHPNSSYLLHNSS